MTTIVRSDDRLDAQASLDTNMVEQFGELLRTDIRATTIASVIFVGIGLYLQIPGVVLIGAAGMTSGLLRQRARFALRDANFPVAVGLMAFGMWLTSYVVVALLPIGIAAMVFNLVTPVVLGATYLSESQNFKLTMASVIAAVGLGLLAYTQPGANLEEGVAQWQVETIAVCYLVGHTWMFAATVRAANHIRMETLEAALIANGELLDTELELRRSRQRLVEVADQERGRIERNIHDGAQQRLISLSMQLRLASHLAANGQAPTPADLDALHVETSEALNEVRELASGIYPSLLADRGLPDAIRAAARRSSHPVTVHGPDQLNLEPQIELALYFAVLEALQNADKHAGTGTTISVDLSAKGSDLSVTIADDGAGFNAAEVGESRGLMNMADRIAAAGGSLDITTGDAVGTTIIATLRGVLR